MCFAPQRHALFRHLNFQKLSKHGVFSTFWCPNVFRATTACNFSSRRLRTNRFSERTFRSSLLFRALAFFFWFVFSLFFCCFSSVISPGKQRTDDKFRTKMKTRKKLVKIMRTSMKHMRKSMETIDKLMKFMEKSMPDMTKSMNNVEIWKLWEIDAQHEKSMKTVDKLIKTIEKTMHT